MRRLTFLFACLLMVGIGLVNAQTKSISGKVISADDGQPVIGATVKVKGASSGVITNAEGVFRIVAQDGQNLVVSYVGMKTTEVPAKQGITVTITSDSKMMNEVVVTALGISREKKSLGYAVQDVKGDEMTKSRGGVNNPINSLAGKVSGLQISSSTGSMGGSSKILLRGSKSISGNNQPLFIVDGVPIEGTDYNSSDTQRGAGGYDYGNLIQDINPDDIESISVLKGANASALYGSRAANGVVMITTKKGSKRKGWGVTLNTGIGIEKVTKLPKMQNEYGGSASDFETVTINGKDYKVIDYSTDESWGPKYDGSQYLSWYDLAKWENAGKVGNPTTSTWQASKHDIGSFFETGTSYTNNVSIAQASENSNVRISYTNTSLTGYMPNSKQQKNAISVNSTAKVNKIYEVSSNITYLNQATRGRSETGYGDNNVMQKFIQWGQRQLDMKELKSLYKYDDGTQAGWNRGAWDDATLQYSNNPYWTRYMNYQNDTRNRIYGNVGLKAYIMPNLTAQFKSNLDYFSDKQYERNAVYSQETSYYGETNRQQYELNNELLLQYNTKFCEDYTLNANVGGNSMKRRFEKLIGYSVGGLKLPEFYNLSNSKSDPKSENVLKEKQIQSMYGGLTLGYKSLLFVDLTLRNDWSSTLPKNNNSYTYYSATGSFLFSELLKYEWLNHAKARLSYAHTGNDTDPYNLYDVYNLYANYNTDHAYQLSSIKNNPGLKPETNNSVEFGLEANMFNNRVGVDITVYRNVTVDQIMPLSLSGATGYTTQYVNGGEVRNTGIEAKFNFTPVKTKDFEWGVTVTAAHNKNVVQKLYGDVQYYKLASGPFKVEVGAKVGQEYGVIMGTNYIYDSKGNKVVSDGLYESTSGNVELGSVNPKVTGGIMNTFRYKNFDMSILLDGQAGGKFFSTSYMWGIYSGMLEETAGLNELGNPKRNAVADGGGVLLKGVNEDGTVNTTRVEASDWASSIYSGPAAQSVLKSDFIKLREITIGYTLPIKSNVISNIKVSAYGRNLAVWGPDTKHFDPESAVTSSGNVQGIEGGAMPMVSTFGLNLSFQF